MTIRLSRRARVLTAATALAMAGTLAGCSVHPGQAGVASYRLPEGSKVTVKVSEKDLDTTCDELAGMGYTCNDVLIAMLQAPLFNDLAEKYGVAASDADAEKMLATGAPEAKSFSAEAKSVAKAFIATQKFNGLDADAATKLSDDITAIQKNYEQTLAPRYSGQTPSWLITSQQQ